MTQIGLTDEDVAAIVSSELLTPGRYTITQPNGRPVFTKEQRDAIAHAVSTAIKSNNEAILQKLRDAGVAGV